MAHEAALKELNKIAESLNRRHGLRLEVIERLGVEKRLPGKSYGKRCLAYSIKYGINTIQFSLTGREAFAALNVLRDVLGEKERAAGKTAPGSV